MVGVTLSDQHHVDWSVCNETMKTVRKIKAIQRPNANINTNVSMEMRSEKRVDDNALE